MSVTSNDVRRLVAAGLIDEATGERILFFEANQPRPAALPALSEVAVYLGAAIVGAGAVVLVAANWGSFPAWARVVVPAFAAVAAFVSGLGFRQAHRADGERAASVAWLLTGALLVAAATIAASEADWSEVNVAAAGAAVAVPAALALWWPSRTHLQLVGLAGALALLAMALTGRVEGDNGITVFGLAVATSGLLGFVAVEAGVLTPRVSARILAGSAMWLGAMFAGLPPGHAAGELVAAALTILLLVASIRLGILTYTIFAVLAAFGGLVIAILRHVEDPTAAALALIVVGIALLGAIAAIGRYRPWRAALERGSRSPPV
jgi:uncharacterized membrane protein